MNILIIVAIIIAIPLVIALFAKNEYLIESEIIIDKPRQEVFNYIKFIKNSENFSKWVMTDPLSLKEYKGTDGTVGFVYAWDSENKQVGKGEQEIIKLVEGELVDSEIRFIKPFEAKSYSSMVISNSENQTKVKWIFNGHLNYPMKIMHLFMNLKKVLGNDMQISLSNLKRIMENNN